MTDIKKIKKNTDIKKIKKNTDTDIEKEVPNIFDKFPKEKLAWLAGLLQGEANFTLDDRGPKKVKTPGYEPAPAIPVIKLEMIEQDVIEEVGKILGETPIELKRLTSAENQVYRVTIEKRDKTEDFLKAILPFVVGEKTRQKILNLLKLCEDHHKWENEGGRSKAARIGGLARAAKAKAEKEAKEAKEKSEEIPQEQTETEFPG